VGFQTDTCSPRIDEAQGNRIAEWTDVQVDVKLQSISFGISMSTVVAAQYCAQYIDKSEYRSPKTKNIAQTYALIFL
jgi:hypothetical protein